MPSSERLLASCLPDEDELYAAVERMELTNAASILNLRKRIKYQPLRCVISGLWFAILYQAVQHKIGSKKETKKES
jgi:hypothetical protein